MSDYEGEIIAESLLDTSILDELNIIKTRVEDVFPEDGTPWLSVWTLHKVRIVHSQAAAWAERFSHLLEHDHGIEWYIDFKNDDTHYVIYRDKVFKVDRRDAAQYRAVQDYGRALKIPESQLVEG